MVKKLLVSTFYTNDIANLKLPLHAYKSSSSHVDFISIDDLIKAWFIRHTLPPSLPQTDFTMAKRDPPDAFLHTAPHPQQPRCTQCGDVTGRLPALISRLSSHSSVGLALHGPRSPVWSRRLRAGTPPKLASRLCEKLRRFSARAQGERFGVRPRILRFHGEECAGADANMWVEGLGAHAGSHDSAQHMPLARRVQETSTHSTLARRVQDDAAHSFKLGRPTLARPPSS